MCKSLTWQYCEDSFDDDVEREGLAPVRQLWWAVVGVVRPGQDCDEHCDCTIAVQKTKDKKYPTNDDEPGSKFFDETQVMEQRIFSFGYQRTTAGDVTEC